MLWIVTNEGAKCVPFYKLMENRGRISMSFNVDNCEYQERMIALAEIMRYFKGLKFDFGSLRDSFTNIAVRFNQPEKALAEKLAKNIPFVRVDFYEVDGKVYFGELTFTSQGGFMDFYTPEFNKELGSKFDIKDFPRK